MSEILSKTAAGKRLKISRQMVARYVRPEMPNDGQGHILWPEAQTWYEENIIPQSSGNWVARHQATKQKPPDGFNLDDPYTRGYLDGFRRARHNIREFLPEVLGEAMGLNVGERVFYLALLDHLMANWLNAAPDAELPPVDWTRFREEAPKELQQYFEHVQKQHGAKI